MCRHERALRVMSLRAWAAHGPKCAAMLRQDVTERKASEAAFQLRDHALSNLSEVGSSCSTAVYRQALVARISRPSYSLWGFHAVSVCACCYRCLILLWVLGRCVGQGCGGIG